MKLLICLTILLIVRSVVNYRNNNHFKNKFHNNKNVNDDLYNVVNKEEFDFFIDKENTAIMSYLLKNEKRKDFPQIKNLQVFNQDSSDPYEKDKAELLVSCSCSSSSKPKCSNSSNSSKNSSCMTSNIIIPPPPSPPKISYSFNSYPCSSKPSLSNFMNFACKFY